MPEMPEVAGTGVLPRCPRGRARGRLGRGRVDRGAQDLTRRPSRSPAHQSIPYRGTGSSSTWTATAYLVFHLAKAGWLRWYDATPATLVRPGKSPIALRVRLSDGSGFDLTEAGTRKSLAVYVVRDPMLVPGIARLGPTRSTRRSPSRHWPAYRPVGGPRSRVLRDQGIIAGVGNAYSDEILHVARLSPYALAASLTDEQVGRLYTALRETLAGAVAAAEGKPAAELKDAKRAGMRVHGRTGAACPECGDVVREVSFADTSLQYCATCQTGASRWPTDGCRGCSSRPLPGHGGEGYPARVRILHPVPCGVRVRRQLSCRLPAPAARARRLSGPHGDLLQPHRVWRHPRSARRARRCRRGAAWGRGARGVPAGRRGAVGLPRRRDDGRGRARRRGAGPGGQPLGAVLLRPGHGRCRAWLLRPRGDPGVPARQRRPGRRYRHAEPVRARVPHRGRGDDDRRDARRGEPAAGDRPGSSSSPRC